MALTICNTFYNRSYPKSGSEALGAGLYRGRRLLYLRISAQLRPAELGDSGLALRIGNLRDLAEARATSRCPSYASSDRLCRVLARWFSDFLRAAPMFRNS